MRWNRAFKQTTVVFQFSLAFLLSCVYIISHNASTSCEACVIDRKISLMGVCKEIPLLFKQNCPKIFALLLTALRCFLSQLQCEYHWGSTVCPGGMRKLLTLPKLCGIWHRAHVSNICVFGTPVPNLCVVTHHSYPADHGSGNSVAITGPDHFLPNNKHSLSSLKIEIFLTEQ